MTHARVHLINYETCYGRVGFVFPRLLSMGEE